MRHMKEHGESPDMQAMISMRVGSEASSDDKRGRGVDELIRLWEGARHRVPANWSPR